MRSVSDFIVLYSKQYPERDAIVFRDRRITYGELNRRINRLSHHFLALGVQTGDRIAYMFYNCNESLEIFHACLKTGAVAVPINFRSIPREVKWYLDNASCKLLLYGQECAGQVNPIKNDLPTVEHVIYSGPNCPPGEVHYEKIVSDGDSNEPTQRWDADDRALILYTGGTTGLPKGAVHTHKSIFFWVVTSMMKNHFADPTITSVNQLPLFHNAGLIGSNTVLGCAGKVVILENMDPQEIMRLIEKEKATFIFLMPPFIYMRILDLPNLRDFDTFSVTEVGTAAGILSKSMMLRLYDAFPNAVLLYGYGLSEGGAGIYHWITRSMVESDSEKIKSCGMVFPFQEAKLVDDQGKEVPVGEVGELALRGVSTMKEYFDQPELTAQTIKDGWVHTGDLLKKDADEDYYFVDRKKDMIKTGGENVFAQEVEQVIMSHPAVELCAVIGVPDPIFQEAIMAVIKLSSGLTATAEEIVEHCKKTLPSYKKPRRIAFVDSFPIGQGMKIQKFKLKEQYGKEVEEK
jgi:acyl-CoA synthetase (AMP-forming)/AMP-acid ligase II